MLFRAFALISMDTHPCKAIETSVSICSQEVWAKGIRYIRVQNAQTCLIILLLLVREFLFFDPYLYRRPETSEPLNLLVLDPGP